MVSKKKSLVVVESPAKAKTINRYLGDDYVVKASMGHVRDLPKKEMGIDLEGGFDPTYQVLPDKKKVVGELKKLARQAPDVYLALDRDREGEAIAWHLSELLGVDEERVHRVIFNEITKNAIADAFDHPVELAMDRVNAQQARRLLDRLVGYELSPLLWKKVVRGLSAGRVQSVAVRLIVEREQAIRAFDPTEYWTIDAALGDETSPIDAKLRYLGDTRLGKKKNRIPDEETASAVVRALQASSWTVAEVEKKKTRSRPKPPFITSTMQQQASIRLGFTASRTMRVAQQLYEGVELGGGEATGLITYMRTDSVHLSSEALSAGRSVIRREYGDEYLPKKPRFYRSKEEAQEAHEAIRPTDPSLTPDRVASHLSRDQRRLYDLIWRTFVASQMTDARFDRTTVRVDATGGTPELGDDVPSIWNEPARFRARGLVLTFDGFTKVLSTKKSRRASRPGAEGEGARLGDLSEGQELGLVEVEPTQKFTQPPPRYTEATLVKTLEKEGIGRPSTYAQIIKTIQKREYVEKDGKRFKATPLGEVVTEKLVEHFPDILNTEFTSKMEDLLDEVEERHRDWKGLLDDFYDRFSTDLERAREEMVGVNEDPTPTDHLCPECGKTLVYRWNKWGRFLGCSGYPDCKQTVKVDDEGEPLWAEETDHECWDCGRNLVKKHGRRGPFYACSGYPECKTTAPIGEDGEPVREEILEETCPQCDEPLVVKMGRRGKFLGCTGYPDCRFTKPHPDDLADEDGEIPDLDLPDCPDCGSELTVRVGRRGKFIGCSAFPTCRHTRPYPGSEEEKKKKASKGKKGGSGKGSKKEGTPEIDETCDECGSEMVLRSGRRGKFLGCSSFPTCRATKPAPDGVKSERSKPEPAGIDCDECGEPMMVRSGRRGKFLGCSSYPKCKNTEPITTLEGEGAKTS